MQAAWGDPRVTMATAEVPAIEARIESEYGSILHAQNSPDVIDYELFMADMKTDAILYFAELAQGGCGRPDRGRHLCRVSAQLHHL